MLKKPLILLLAALYAMSAAAGDHSFQKMAVERLPDLHMPRGCSHTLLLGNEFTVVGGHTTGFKPAETLEYYSGGSWHSIPMTWPHDGGCVALMPDGKLFLAGGNAEAFGIGQSWGAEIYDPATHSFAPIGIMDRKRTSHSALALPDGRVVISGNWYGPDGIETYTSGAGFTSVMDLDPGICFPYILRAPGDDFLIFGQMSSYGDSLGVSVHRLKGDPFSVPQLDGWQTIMNWSVSDDEQKIADYTYLILANRRDCSESAIMKVSGGDFSTLELESPIPVEGPFGNAVYWTSGPQVDRSGRLAWIQGSDLEGRIYFARIDYNATFDGGKASVQLYYAETPEGFPLGKALLLPGGKMLLAGGVAQASGQTLPTNDNFNTFSSVYLFHTEEPGKAGIPLWVIAAGFLLLCFAVVMLGSWLRRKKAQAEAPAEKAQKLNADLMEEMSRLIEEKELFLRKDLRVADIAKELATNQTYVSLLVNNLTGSGFSDLINGYRIRYAQELMLKHPDMVHGDVAIASGFASRTAFLRTFKAKTGLSPTEWKETQGRKG